jgi:hypothetical protein
MVKHLLVIGFVLLANLAHSQTPGRDSTPVSSNDLMIDTTIDYDELFNEFDLFLDSILTPRSYFLANMTVGQGYFNFTNKTNSEINTVRKYVFSPTIGYYGKKGFGFTVAGNMIKAEGKMNLYQVSVSPSFDYLKNRSVALGFAYMRYITKDSLPFYVSPLENEINAYFVWRKTWLQPGIAVNWGWGSRTGYEKRLKFIERLQRRVLFFRRTEESIADFSLTVSVKHDFYWINVFSKKDYIKFAPQFSFSSGTQQFGFNQTTGTYGLKRLNTLFNSGNVNLDDKVKFQPISVTAYIRTEYSLGKFFIQPQLLFDYYFPAKEDNLTTLFSVNTGFIF